MTQPPLRVISVTHTAHGEGSGRLRYEPLQNDPRLDLKIVVPDRWKASGRLAPVEPLKRPLDLHPLKVRLPYLRGVQWYAHWYGGLGKLIRSFRPQVLHLWEEPWSLVALQATLLRNRYAQDCALIFETDQNILRRLPFPFQQIRRYTLSQTDWLLSRHPEATEVSQASGYSGDTTLIGYCVDRAYFHQGHAQLPSQITQATPRALRLGYVGRIIREKGLFTILEALQQTASKSTFTLVGNGPAKEDLQQLANRLGLTDRVFFEPPQPPEKVGQFMSSLDALVLMSETTATWKEQFGRVIIEAQACGVPVIGSDSGSIPAVVSHGGWIVPEKDPLALALLLDTLSTHPAMLAEASGEALRNVEQYTPQAIASTLVHAFEQAASRRQQRRSAHA